MMEDKACGAVVYRRKSNVLYFLLVKHYPAGHWGFPKGHAEPGETEEQTARREILEETGLDLELKPGFRWVIQYYPRSMVKKEVVYFLAESQKKKVRIQEKELSNAVWLELEDALVLATHEGTRDLLKQAHFSLLSLEHSPA